MGINNKKTRIIHASFSTFSLSDLKIFSSYFMYKKYYGFSPIRHKYFLHLNFSTKPAISPKTRKEARTECPRLLCAHFSGHALLAECALLMKRSDRIPLCFISLYYRAMFFLFSTCIMRLTMAATSLCLMLLMGAKVPIASLPVRMPALYSL